MNADGHPAAGGQARAERQSECKRRLLVGRLAVGAAGQLDEHALEQKGWRHLQIDDRRGEGEGTVHDDEATKGTEDNKGRRSGSVLLRLKVASFLSFIFGGGLLAPPAPSSLVGSFGSSSSCPDDPPFSYV